MVSMMKVGYLGPAGTFTHQAASLFFPRGVELLPFDNVGQIFEALHDGEIDFGVAAIDNTVEGPVLPTIDGLLNHPEVVAVGGTWLPIQFDAYALAGTEKFEVGTGHPHALAQVSRALKQFAVEPLAAASNGAGLANLTLGQIAFGPPGYAQLGVVTVAENVGDYPDAKTQFVLLSPRSTCGWDQSGASIGAQWATMLAITPGATGPGVLARITAEFASHDLNLSALFSRPIKGVVGRYVFIVTVDAPPTSAAIRQVITELTAAGDEVRLLGAWQ